MSAGKEELHVAAGLQFGRAGGGGGEGILAFISLTEIF